MFLAAVTGGSVIVFLAALPWVYHEAYLWATACAVGDARRPRRRSPGGRPIAVAVVTAVFAVATILTRTTTGWALAITVIVVGAVSAARRTQPSRRPGARRRRSRRHGRRCGGQLGEVPPPVHVSARAPGVDAPSSSRRLALLMNGGTITGPQFFLSSLVNYFRPDGIRFMSYFPFVSLPAEPARSYGGAFLDQAYRTGSVPAFMPLLFLLGTVGFVGASVSAWSRRSADCSSRSLGALAAGGGVMLYGYLANRYTSGLRPRTGHLRRRSHRRRRRRLEQSPPSVRRLAVVAVAHRRRLRHRWPTPPPVWPRPRDMAWRAARAISVNPTRRSATSSAALTTLVVQSSDAPGRAPADTAAHRR